MMMKYRVSEVAKDFNVPSKEIIELLAKYIDTPKKSMTALEESELDLIFEHYTQKYQTENFDAYYATAKEKKEEPAPAASEAAATAAPAKLMKLEGKIGCLSEGARADIAIFRWMPFHQTYRDWKGSAFSADNVLKAEMTIKDGDIVYCAPDYLYEAQYQ